MRSSWTFICLHNGLTFNLLKKRGKKFEVRRCVAFRTVRESWKVKKTKKIWHNN
jgi:hypothetical protein